MVLETSKIRLDGTVNKLMQWKMLFIARCWTRWFKGSFPLKPLYDSMISLILQWMVKIFRFYLGAGKWLQQKWVYFCRLPCQSCLEILSLSSGVQGYPGDRKSFLNSVWFESGGTHSRAGFWANSTDLSMFYKCPFPKMSLCSNFLEVDFPATE